MQNMQQKRISFFGRFFKAAYILLPLRGPPETVSLMNVMDNHYTI
jgi:hypothetical protein